MSNEGHKYNNMHTAILDLKIPIINSLLKMGRKYLPFRHINFIHNTELTVALYTLARLVRVAAPPSDKREGLELKGLSQKVAAPGQIC